MDFLKKIGHWIVFLIGGYLGTWLALLISVALPLVVGLWIFDWNDFLFLFVGGILMTLYYLIVFIGLSWYYDFINRKKPDYWASNIFLVIVAIYFFYTFITSFGRLVDQDVKVFAGFKGIILLLAIIPAYFKILFVSLIAPFFKRDNE
jgi:hypothetical protein